MKKIQNRRKGPDSISKFISLIIAASWVLLLVLLIIYTIARPKANFMSGITGAGINQSMGDLTISAIVLPVLLVQLLLCLLGLILSSKRMKRKRDKYSMSLIFFTIVSVMGIIAYFIMF